MKFTYLFLSLVIAQDVMVNDAPTNGINGLQGAGPGNSGLGGSGRESSQSSGMAGTAKVDPKNTSLDASFTESNGTGVKSNTTSNSMSSSMTIESTSASDSQIAYFTMGSTVATILLALVV